MIPNPITLAQAGRLSAAAAQPVSAATVRIIPTVAAAEPVEIPAPRASVAAYFGLFRACGCGHSSAWHSGAFGDAWRAGQQVRGRCEAAVEDGSASGCSCARFNEPNLAS